MKTKIVVSCFVALVALLLGAGCAHAPENTGAGAAAVAVTFNQPENFTDVKSSSIGSDKERDSLLDELRDYVVEQAPRFLKDGQALSIVFNDIDMAGDFEPWRGPALDDVRIVKDIYPPRIALVFSLKDAGGAEIAGGARNLTDLAFMSTIPVTVFRDDRLRHEKTLLYNWFSGELARLARQ